MQQCELMVFDLDGTLVDSGRDLIMAANFTRNALGMPAMDDREIIRLVGDGTDKLIERIIGPEFQFRQGEALDIFLAYYEGHLLDNTILYPGVREVLVFFKQKKKVIITNKRAMFARKITDHFAITAFFDGIVGIGKDALRKPDPRVLLPFLERFDIAPEEAVIVGDGVADLNLARNCGVKSCALLNGFTPREVLLSLKPDFTCEELPELMTLFC